MAIRTISNEKKPRIVLYGTEGIGKTTLCANEKIKPVFILTEDGIGNLTLDADDVCKTFTVFKEQLAYIKHAELPYKTLVIDSIDWLEKLIHEEIAADEGKNHVGEIPFGKGYSQAAGLMAWVLNELDEIRDKGMMVILVAHSKIKRFESPDSDSFDRYTLDLHEKANSIIREWADCIFFAAQQVSVKKIAGEFGKVEKKGVGDGKRVIYTQERPAYMAKNRYGLAHEQPFDLVEILREVFKK